MLGSHPITVQPDVVNSMPFLAAAMVTGGTVTILGWPAVTAQPAGHILRVLRDMGADAALGPDGLTVTGPAALRGITADLTDCSEISMVLGALAALAELAFGADRDRPPAATRRPTGSPPWPPRSTPWAARSPSGRTGWRSGRSRCGPAAPSPPTTITGW